MAKREKEKKEIMVEVEYGPNYREVFTKCMLDIVQRRERASNECLRKEA